jgi:hypothetical protein
VWPRATLLPSPLVGEGGAKRRVRGLSPRREPLIRLRFAWALDQHTLAGRKMGRGLHHFREHGAKLVPEPTEPDPYIEEAYRLWAIKQQSK